MSAFPPEGAGHVAGVALATSCARCKHIAASHQLGGGQCTVGRCGCTAFVEAYGEAAGDLDDDEEPEEGADVAGHDAACHYRTLAFDAGERCPMCGYIAEGGGDDDEDDGEDLDEEDDDDGDPVDDVRWTGTRFVDHGASAAAPPRYWSGQERPCEYCGTMFRATRSDARFCNTTGTGRCKKAANRAARGAKPRPVASSYRNAAGEIVTVTAEERIAGIARIAAAERARQLAERDRYRRQADSARHSANHHRSQAERYDREAKNADRAADQIEAEQGAGQQVIPGAPKKRAGSRS